MPNDRGEKPVVHTRKHIARLERERRQTRLILYSFIGILVIVVGLLVYGYLDVTYFQLEKPVARVGEVEISTRDFQTRVRLQRNQMLSTYGQYVQIGESFGMDVSAQLQQIEAQLANTEQVGQTVIDQMINEELIRQEAAQRDIHVTQDEITAAIQADLNFYPDGTPTPSLTPTPVSFPTLSPETLKLVSPTPSPTATPDGSLTPSAAPESTGTVELVPSPTASATPSATATQGPTSTPAPSSTPRPTSTPYTLEGFQTEYQNGLERLAKFGLTEEQYRKLYESNLLREKLLEIVAADVAREEEQVWARHILLADEATAKQVLERLNNGEDFGALAAELSQDTGSGAQGGDLGWFGHGVMVTEFETAAFALEVGEISQPVQSSFGFHIIQVIAKQDRPLTESEYQSARERAFSEFLTGLREEYGVEVFDAQWKQHVPEDPNFSTLATEAVQPQP